MWLITGLPFGLHYRLTQTLYKHASTVKPHPPCIKLFTNWLISITYNRNCTRWKEGLFTRKREKRLFTQWREENGRLSAW